ncbi:hypothetical protein Phum_PHUM586180 [Pediculus humanus corporis]|uniref:Uncharacterized protein n=1 Tax=Pediculus humanus subsp. corporis TaxID=121224 RepID=E0W274_PEDHC|nr:uncharacterized protein Phum_PHUM586180 [Pediculus humanus corporis]EEB19730.1 hypothetical protein Phum_PHUM586180 [Pediculus humanus corporis]
MLYSLNFVGVIRLIKRHKINDALRLLRKRKNENITPLVNLTDIALLERKKK